MNYALNVSSTDKCSACADTGWVELAGTVKRNGVTGSRGTAPCKWCEAGKDRYARRLALRGQPKGDVAFAHGTDRQPVETNFALADVVMPDTDPRPFKPNADFLREMERDFGTPRAVLWELYPERIWPKEWPKPRKAGVVKAIPRSETAKDVERKRKVEQDRLAVLEDQATVELPAEPAPTQPNYDDVPF